MEFLEKHTIHEDDRGQLLRVINKYAWGEINFVTSRAGIARGNHYHRSTKELFYILSGEVQIDVKNIVDKVENHFRARPHMAFIIDPYELHTFTTIEDSSWINVLSRPMDDDHPDFFRISEEH